MRITVYLADDHKLIRDGLRAILAGEPGLEIVGTAADGRAAVREITALKPDIAIMDIAMPELNGIEAAGQLRERCPDVKIIILSMHANREYARRALEYGARGYLLKESAGTEVVRAVRTVAAGNRYISDKMRDALVDGIGEKPKPNPLAELSSREMEVLQLVVEGKSSREIAQILRLSPKSVDTYRSRLMQKLGTRDVPSLVKFAIQHGITSLE